MSRVESDTWYFPGTVRRSAWKRSWVLSVFIAVGVGTSLLHFGWWLDGGRLLDPWAVLGLVLASLWVFLQIYTQWFVYLRMKSPDFVAPRRGMSVDVFLPVYDESNELVEQGLEAVQGMQYPHRTFLLDDDRDPERERLARRYDAEYLTRADNACAKAGNVNAALSASDADFVAIFDVDHLPEKDFLDHVLGHFEDPGVGFVQSAVGFRNANESWVARAAAEQALDAYGPSSMGMYGCGAAPVWGSHTTFRRKALDSVSGYQPGLAEDLCTSLSLHVAGWRSVFVPHIRAHGLVPSDLGGFSKQQLKWSRGVFEVLASHLPRVLGRLSLPQAMAFLLRSSYYLVGLAFLVHCLIGGLVLLFGESTTRGAFAQYVLHAAPFALFVLAIRRLALLGWREHTESITSNWRAYPLTFFLWPVYTRAFLEAVFRRPMEHVSTPKESLASGPLLVLPQILLTVFLFGAVAFRGFVGWEPVDLVPSLFAVVAGGVQLFALINASLR